MPVLHAQNIKDPNQATRILEGGYVDMVGMTRAHIAKVWGEQESRKDFSEAFGALGLSSVAGTSFDARTNSLHVLVTSGVDNPHPWPVFVLVSRS